MKSLLILQIFHELSNVSCGSDLNSGTQRSVVGNLPLISSPYSLSSCYSQLNSAVGVMCDPDVLSGSDPNSGMQQALHQFQFNKPSHLPLCKLFLFAL